MITRRNFLHAGLGAAVWSTLPRIAFGEDYLLQSLEAPQDLGTPIEYFDRLITPTPVFFVRSHFGPPALQMSRSVEIGGLVDRPARFTINDLKQFPETTITSVLQCAGNGRGLQEPHVPGVQWLHGAMGQAQWTGVRLSDVLKETGVQSSATHVQLLGADLPPKPAVPKFLRSIPLSRAIDRDTLLAYKMNGEPLTLAHGAPLRLIVPGWAGDHWIKWLTQITLADKEADGFYMKTAYKIPKSPVTPGTAVPPDHMTSLTVLPVKSIIASPRDGEIYAKAPREIVGVAFSGTAPVKSVEVSTDGGATWKVARLEGEAGIGRWQLFHAPTPKGKGSFRAMARATDAAGNVQPRTAAWNPSGYFWNAWHAVSWTVKA